MQINRLFEIVYILLAKKTTAQELAQRFEVSLRTIYRDIDTLCKAGIPIYTSQGKGGGITLLDNFVLNKSVLSEREQNDILIALQSLSATQYPEVELVLSKLSSLFKKSDVNWIEIDFSPWGSNEKQKEKFSKLKNAVINDQIIAFEYFNASGEKSARRIRPMKLAFKEKAWYLLGYCLHQNACRTFKITRMSNIHSLEAYDAKKFPGASTACFIEHAPNKYIDLQLKISPQGAYRIYDDFDEKNIEKHQDGSFTVKASLPAGDWLYNYILSFGTVLESIEPQSVRKSVAAKLEKMLDTMRENQPS